MKKYLFCLVLIFSLSITSYAQNMDQLFQKISKIENVDQVKVGRFLMSLGKQFGGVGDIPLARGVHSIEILDLSSCKPSAKQDLSKYVAELKDGGGYETWLQVNDKKNAVRIMAKKKNDIIQDLVILCNDEASPTIIRLSGKMKENDLAELANKYNK